MKTPPAKTENFHIFVPVFVHGFQPRYQVVALLNQTYVEKLLLAETQLENINHFTVTEH